MISSKEQLEEIKKQIKLLRGDMSVTSIEVDIDAYIILDDMEWLIEQAEQTENLKNAFDDLDSDYIDLVKQNERYREFLEDMYNHAYGLQLYPHVVDEIKKLLEESE